MSETADMLPTSMLAMAVMLLMHGFFLDIIIIGIIPFLSPSKGTSSRKALFPWCLGGYSGFGTGEDAKRDDVQPNLSPTHRRFIAENAAYAILRGGAGLYVLLAPALAMPALVLAVASHWAEAVTIAWEIFSYRAPADAAPPMTLMGIFSTWTLLTVMNNSGDYLTVDDTSTLLMQVGVGLTWFSWLFGVAGVMMNKRSGYGRTMG